MQNVSRWDNSRPKNNKIVGRSYWPQIFGQNSSISGYWEVSTKINPESIILEIWYLNNILLCKTLVCEITHAPKTIKQFVEPFDPKFSAKIAQFLDMIFEVSTKITLDPSCIILQMFKNMFNNCIWQYLKYKNEIMEFIDFHNDYKGYFMRYPHFLTLAVTFTSWLLF